MELDLLEFDHLTLLVKQQQLFKECFPEVFNTEYTDIKYSIEKYKWQYHSLPAIKPSFEYIAMVNDELVGYYASLPFRYKIKDQEALSGMVCGVMTSSKYRKAGIFTTLGNFASDQQRQEGVDFNITFPIRKAVMPGFLRMGWNIIFKMPLYIKFIKLNSLLKSKKLSYFSPIFNSLLNLYNFAINKKDNKHIVIKLYHSFSYIDDYLNFISTYNSKIDNTLIKDMAFSEWRYSSPDSKYLFFCAYKNQKLIGITSVRSTIRQGVPSYVILDFMSIDTDSLNNLHNAVLSSAKSNGIEAIMLMMSRTSSKKYKLIENGFFKSPFNFHLIMKNISNRFKNEVLFKEDSWHLMFVDSDDL